MQQFVERHWGGWRDDLFWADIDKDNITLIEQSGKVVGFFDVAVEGETLRLRNIQLDRECQGRGIGKYMMSLVGEKAEKMRLGRISLRVFVDNPAVGFYEHLGFRVVEKNESSLVMTKICPGAAGIDYAIAQEEDGDAIRELLALLNGDRSDLEVDKFVIARDRDILVGCVRLKVLCDGGLELSSLGVLPAYRVRGIGSRLVRQLLSREKRRPIFLLTSSDMERFYERFGARIVAPGKLPAGIGQEYARVSALPFARGIRVIVMIIE